ACAGRGGGVAGTDARGGGGEALGGRLRPPAGAPRSRTGLGRGAGPGPPPAEMHLEAGNLPPVVIGDDLALEPDVGDLDAGTGVRAAVDVQGDGLVEEWLEIAQPLLELGDRPGRRRLGLDDRELAELDPRAGHGGATEDARGCGEAERGGPVEEGVDALRVEVEDDDLLVGGEPDPP